jgi:hypothetical protein
MGLPTLPPSSRSYLTDILHFPARVVVTQSVPLASADAPHRPREVERLE